MLTRLLHTACAAAAATAAIAQPGAGNYANPILPGDWSDPALIRVGDDYYTCRSSFGWQPGLPIAHSRDLRNWRLIGHAFTSHPALSPGDTRGGIWGSEMGFNPNTREFVIYAPTRDHTIHVFHSSRPEGPYAMATLGGQLGIDPGFFADDDGRLYLVTSRAVIHELSRDGLHIEREVARLDRRRYAFFEGPDIFRHGDWYYLLFSDGGTLPHEPSTISTLRARSLAGPWEEDPNNPVMFSTGEGARFEGPAHGTLIETQTGEWLLAYHAHETAFYSLGRQMLMQRVEWTDDGWWRPTTGRVPTDTFNAPRLPATDISLQQSDEFDTAAIGLQWFFLCAPDLSGRSWSLSERPGMLRLRTQPGDLGSRDALPCVFQQRVTAKRFSFETRVTFGARDGREAAGLHLYHDPRMNLWLASSVRDGHPTIEVGKTAGGQRSDLWSAPNPFGATVHLKIAVDGAESATFFFGPDGVTWTRIGESVYFGASAHHLRDGRIGDPDLGWVGTYKSRNAAGRIVRDGNVWTATTFGVFAVRDGAAEPREADFDYVRVTPAQP